MPTCLPERGSAVRSFLGVLIVIAVQCAGAPCRADSQVTVPATDTIPTLGHPYLAWAVPDGVHLLVTETGVAREFPGLEGPRPDERVGGIEVFRIDGGTLHSERFVPLGAFMAQGIVPIPGTSRVAVAMTNAGVMLADVEGLLRGDVVQSYIPMGRDPGSSTIAASPDGHALFVANEYGDGGSVGVLSLRERGGRLTSAELVNTLSMPRAAPGLALSPDGSRLYVTAEVATSIDAEDPGSRDERLGRNDCHQGDGPGMPNGLLYVFDTARAITPGQGGALLAKVAAGCSPVRVVVSSNGTAVYVTARGDDRLLQFDAAKLEHEPSRSLIRALPSGGRSPVGLQLFAGEHKMLVANSDRFENADGVVAVLDLDKGSIERTIEAGRFPRGVSLSTDSRTLYVTNFVSRSLTCVPIE